MSIRVSSMVWDHAPAEVTGNLKLALLVYADHASDDGTNAWPSIATVARKVGVEPRSAKRLVRKLEALNLLEADGWGGYHNHRDDRRPRNYRVVVENLTHGVTGLSPRSPHGVTAEVPRGDSRGPHGVTAVSPEPSMNHPEPSVADDGRTLWIDADGRTWLQ